MTELPYNNRNSIPSIMRRRRFQIVNRLIQDIIDKKGSCRILDIGGTHYYWALDDDYLNERRGKVTIIVANVDEPTEEKNELCEYVVGDATAQDIYESYDYDLIHSNSVIEHVGAWPKVKAMADHIRASQRAYYIQTPNYWFPVEPHFRSVGFQWLPESTRASMLMKRQRGFRGPAKNWDDAMDLVESVKLLTASQLRGLFPEAALLRERIGPLTKSFMVVGNGH
ncbi:SAM-dependent methyltransferase [Microvirga flavescens]|uniref:SAM-dependent methyltransferase n=1 Tax=Microvirga flavescens TaxID=2249811 RepID=UPI0013004C7A|nr:SAM-dependent methyltransferase [Microvirga flavescens]